MDRQEATAYLRKITLAAELVGDENSRSAAFRRALVALEAIGDAQWQDWLRSGQPPLPGVDDAIARPLRELARSGSAAELDAHLLQIPPGLWDLLRVPGIGPARARALWKQANIVTLKQLQRTCQRGSLAHLPGFGKELEVRIIRELRLMRRSHGRWLRLGAQRVADAWRERLSEVRGVSRLALAGEIRRARETVTEIVWVVAATDPGLAIGRLAGLPDAALSDDHPDVVQIHVRDEPPQRILVVSPERFAARLFLETGSTEHIRAILRRIGIVERNEREDTAAVAMLPAGPEGAGWLPRSEEEIYARGQLPLIPPELREGRGEIAAAARGELPRLIEADELRGVFHVHSDWSDGRCDLATLVGEAIRLGWDYIGIADHSPSAFYARGLSPQRLVAQGEEIRRLQAQHPQVRLLHGVESDILPDGRLDYRDEILARLDFVIVSVHSLMQMDREAMTRRIVRAIRHPRATILAHPSGRLLLEREPYAVDWDAIFSAAAEAGTAIEFSTAPERLDLDWRLIRAATQRGVRLSINPDAHRLEAFWHVPEGVRTARKGWLTAGQVINTLPIGELEELLDVPTSGPSPPLQ